MKPTPIHYRVDLSQTRTREVKVEMGVNLPDSGPVEVFLPQMSPGSPVASQGQPTRLSGLTAQDAAGQPVPLQPLEDGGWRMQAKGPVSLHYTIKADEFSDVRAFLSPEQAYLNGSAALLAVKGHEHDTPSTIALVNLPEPTWDSSSTLPKVIGQPHTFYASSYDDVADDNIVIGHFETASAQVGNTTLKVVQQGANPYPNLTPQGVTPQENLEDFTKIWKCFLADFGSFPSERRAITAPRPDGVEQTDEYTIHKHYTSTGEDTTDGLEHYRGHEMLRHSASEGYIQRNFDGSARRNENYTMAHEVVHKLLAKLVQHDGIDSADLTKLHTSDGLWLTEGVTNWVGYLLERQSGLITQEQYLDRWAGAIDGYYQDYATRPTNGRDDSLEAQEGNGRYYNKGSMAGLALDLELRQLSGGEKGLLDVLRDLKDEFGGTGRFHKLEDIQRLAANVASAYPGGREKVEGFFTDHLEGRERIEMDDYLAHAGLHLTQKTDGWKPGKLNFDGVQIITDASGRPGLKLDPSARNAGEKFALYVPSMGFEMQPNGHVDFVYRNSPAAAAGLHNFPQRTPDGLVFRTAAGDVDLAKPRDVDPSEVQALVFLYGTREVVVPTGEKAQTAIESVAHPTPEQLALRDQWLAELPLS